MAVYFILDAQAGRVKIGSSKDPWARLSVIQTGSSATLKMVAIIDGDASTERALHQRFSAFRARGEWFNHRAELANFVAALPPAVRVETRSKPHLFWNGIGEVEAAAIAGVSRSLLTHIRLGNRRPSPEVAIALQRATGVSAIRLVFGELAEEAA